MYCDFIDTKVDVRLYKEVFDLEKLREIVETYLTEYNAMSKKPMYLVLFRYHFYYFNSITNTQVRFEIYILLFCDSALPLSICQKSLVSSSNQEVMLFWSVLVVLEDNP